MTYDDDPRSDVDRIKFHCLMAQNGARLAYIMADKYRSIKIINHTAILWQIHAASQHEDAKHYLDQLLYPVKEG